MMDKSGYIEVDFNIRVSRIKADANAPILEVPVKFGLRWEDADHTDVIPLCKKGLEITRAIIESRDKMGFS